MKKRAGAMARGMGRPAALRQESWSLVGTCQYEKIGGEAGDAITG